MWYQTRLAGNVFAQMADDQAGIDVVPGSRSAADINVDRLADVDIISNRAARVSDQQGYPGESRKNWTLHFARGYARVHLLGSAYQTHSG
jgi:hypothetical protein